MKTILVPTDFSVNAENALAFALLLAKEQNYRIVLLHAFQIPVSAGAVPYDMVEAELEEKKNESERMLRAECMKIDKAGGVNFEHIAVEGGAVDTILDTSKDKRADLIVIGTRGAGGFAAGIFGSTASKVIEKATCPVIAIPESAAFRTPIKKITYATDYHQSDVDAIKALVEMTSAMGAQVNILHISNNKDLNAGEERELMIRFMKEVNAHVNYNNLSFQMLNGDDVKVVLEGYLAGHNADMLVMSTHIRNLFDKIFDSSLTRSMALHTSVPLMVFHYNPKTAARLS